MEAYSNILMQKKPLKSPPRPDAQTKKVFDKV